MPFPRRALAAALLTTCALVPAGPASAAGCPSWEKEQVASGYGVLENLGFDGTGGVLLSEGALAGGAGGLRRLAADGTRATVVEPVSSPGGIVVGSGADAGTVFFTSGNGFASGILGLKDGAINAVDLVDGAAVGAPRIVATGLTMPNGMVRLPDGDFLVSRDVLGPAAVTTRVRTDGSSEPFAPSVTSTNGMAVDADRGLVYIASTFNLLSTVSVVRLADPSAKPRVIVIPGLGPLNAADDLVLGPDGYLYVALNLAGKVVRVDPDSGAVCQVAKGIPFVSSLRFGAGPGWDPGSLYTTSFLGKVTRIKP